MILFFRSLLIIGLCMLFSNSEAQYYVETDTAAGINPGNLNHDPELAFASGLPADWVLINNGFSSTPSWSANQLLPFTFLFNNVPVTGYKVSTSGVLTFDLNTTLLPGDSAVILPDTSVPDKSVCVLGLIGSGTVMIKTFGTAPNRQQWITFCSFGIVGCHTFWSIVLEESSNNIYVTDQNTNGCTIDFSIGIQINATTAISLAGSPNLHSLSAGNPSTSDNSYYSFIYGVQPLHAARLLSVDVISKVTVPASVTISGIIKNRGADTIHALDITYRLNGSDYSWHYSNVSIPPGVYYNFTHPTSFNVTSPSANPLTVWVDVNGDPEHADDTLHAEVQGLLYLPAKHVLIEQVSGTWCGWCPLGYFFLSEVSQQHPSTVSVVSVHNNDPMQDSAYNSHTILTVTAVPHGNIDRSYFDVNADQYENYYQQRIAEPVEAAVSFTSVADTITRLADFNVTATFAGNLKRGYRLGVIITEDSVHGSSAGYAQANYFSHDADNIAFTGNGHDWQAEPNPVGADSMWYNNVGRTVLGGYEGELNSIPDSVVAGNSYSYSFSTIIPSGWNMKHLTAIAFLTDTVTGVIVNSIETKVLTVTGINQLLSENTFSIYPNPAGSYFQIDVTDQKNYSVNIFDVNGKQIMESAIIPGCSSVFPVDNLPSGIYAVTVSNINGRFTKKLVVR